MCVNIPYQCFSFWLTSLCISSVQFSLSAMSDPLQPHELQRARPPCPSPTAGVYPNPCPLSWWCQSHFSARLIITFLPRSKRLLISWLQSPSAVILEPQKMNSDTVSSVSPSISYEVMGPDAMISIFWMLSFKPPFSLSSFTFIQRTENPKIYMDPQKTLNCYSTFEIKVQTWSYYAPWLHTILQSYANQSNTALAQKHWSME